MKISERTTIADICLDMVERGVNFFELDAVQLVDGRLEPVKIVVARGVDEVRRVNTFAAEMTANASNVQVVNLRDQN